MEQTEYFRDQYRQRVAVEHRIGRLMQLGVRQSRYLGRSKTQFQVLMAATVAHLTLVAGAVGGQAALLCSFVPALAFRWAILPIVSRWLTPGPAISAFAQAAS